MAMAVHVHYAGKDWTLEEGATRADVQTSLMNLFRSGGGITEFDLAGGGTLAIAVSPGVAVAVTEEPIQQSAYARLPR